MPDPRHCPAWARNAVFYQIFPDRFAKSTQVHKPKHVEDWNSPPTPNGYKGGDLLGVAENLDWLVDLGVSAIYLNPIFSSTANHRYHTYDYMSIDPILGGDAAFKTLLKQAHKKGIRIILDGVFNHASRGFYQFNHTLENGNDSLFKDWFFFDEERLSKRKCLLAYPEELHQPPGYKAWWNLHALPKINLRQPEARRYILDSVRKWMEMGIDGWRLDVPMEIEDRSFWDEFRNTVLAIRRDAYLVGEIWDPAPEWVKDGKPFDAVMNYPLTKALLGFCGGENLDLTHFQNLHSYRDVKCIDSGEFSKTIHSLFDIYGPERLASQFNLLDSHDTPRFLTSVKDEEKILAQAFFFLCTFPGIPCIYYGDEIGMKGGHDPACRGGFVWEKKLQNRYLLKEYRQSIAFRKKHPVLINGDYLEFDLKDPKAYAFIRFDKKQAILILINASGADKELSLNLEAAKIPPKLVRAFGNQPIKVEAHGYNWKVAAI